MSAALTQSATRTLTQSEIALLDLFVTKARYIWTREARDPPYSPSGEQRAFRKTFSYPSDKGAPSHVTLLVAGDDYFAMYVNGVLVQPADTHHKWDQILAFDVPLPVVQPNSTSSVDDANLVIGFRGVNLKDFAGIAVAAQVEYESAAAPDVFYTGSDQSWLGEKLFQEQWEQPSFNRNGRQQAGGATWDPAVVYSQDARREGNVRMVREEVMVFDRLPSNAAVSSGPRMDSASSSPRSLVGLSKGEFAGLYVGSLVLVAVISALVSWFITKRKVRVVRVRRKATGDLNLQSAGIYQPPTLPGMKVYDRQSRSDTPASSG
ncbi:hypothetical protein DFP72DRAFT_897260, partial [Ephemerocybe angulata]